MDLSRGQMLSLGAAVVGVGILAYLLSHSAPEAARMALPHDLSPSLAAAIQASQPKRNGGPWCQGMCERATAGASPHLTHHDLQHNARHVWRGPHESMHVDGHHMFMVGGSLEPAPVKINGTETFAFPHDSSVKGCMAFCGSNFEEPVNADAARALETRLYNLYHGKASDSGLPGPNY